jgi:hypothetical protein
MFVKRLWSLAALWILAYVIFSVIERVTDASASDVGAKLLVYLVVVVAYFALWLVPAFMGNSWRAASLTRRGYELAREVQAETADAAVALVARGAQQATAATSAAPSTADS